MLGSRCNMSCRHCLQNDCDKDDMISSLRLNDDMLNYLNGLAKLKTVDEKIQILFWGGEPLLYLDTIENVCRQLTDDKFFFTIITNGLLLNDDTVSILNDLDVHVTISNDGRYTEHVRGVNILEDDNIIKNIAKINSKSFLAVTSAYNQNYTELVDYIHNKCDTVRVFSSDLKCKHYIPDDILNIDLVKYEQDMDTLINKVHAGILNGEVIEEYYSIEPMLSNIMGIVKAREKGLDDFYNFPQCGQTKLTLSVDFEGNIYACHDYVHKIGTIYDNHDALMQKYDLEYNIAFNREDCAKCDLVEFCRAGCPFVLPSVAKEKICKANRIYILAILKLISMFANAKLLEEVEILNND